MNLKECGCIFCAGRKNFSKASTEDVCRSSHSKDRLFLAKLPGISPVSPDYTETEKTQGRNFETIAWHWPEYYLASLYWEASLGSVEKGDEHFIAYSPFAFEEGMAEQENLQKNTQIERQLLEDQKRYIEYQLNMMTLQENLPANSGGLILTFEEAQKELERESKVLLANTLNAYQSSSTTLSADSLTHFQTVLKDRLERCSVLDSYWIHWQDQKMSHSMQEKMSENQKDLPAVPRNNTNMSVEALQDRHQTSLVKPTEGEQEQLHAAWHKCKENHHYLKEQYMTLEKNELPAMFNNSPLSLDEARRMLQTCLEMSQKKLIILKRYILGAQSVHEHYPPQLSTPTGSQSSERISSIIASQSNEHIVMGSPLSPDSIDTNLSDDGRHTGLKKALTPYELLGRFVQWGDQAFLTQTLKSYTPETHAFFENEAAYKTALEVMIARFPTLEPILSQVGSHPTTSIKEKLKEWEKTMKDLQENTRIRLDAWDTLNSEYKKQKTYQANSHQMRIDCLIDGIYAHLPERYKESFFHLEEKQREQFMAQINQGQWAPFLRWFMKMFERYHPVLFVQEALTFLAPYQGHFEQYKTQLDHCMNRFRDTREMWKSLDYFAKNRCYQAMYDHRDEQIIIDMMQHRWYPLRKKIAKKCLQEGLHPHASLNIPNKERLANILLSTTLNTHLKTAYETLDVDAFRAYFEQKTVPLYYFLDSGGVTLGAQFLNDIQGMMNQVTSRGAESHRALWETLALVISLFHSFADNQSNRQTLQGILDDFEKQLREYWEKFTQSENSLWGKFWRQETVRKNRLEKHTRFEACHRGMSAHFSHLYACSKALDQESKNLVRHNFGLFKGGQGSLEKMVKAFLDNITGFFNKINAQSTLPHLAQIDWRTAPFPEVKYATQSHPDGTPRQSLRVVPLAYQNLTYREKTDRLMEADENLKKAREETLKVTQEKDAKLQEKEAELQINAAELQEKDAEIEEIKRRLAFFELPQPHASELNQLSSVSSYRNNAQQGLFKPVPNHEPTETDSLSADEPKETKKKSECRIS